MARVSLDLKCVANLGMLPRVGSILGGVPMRASTLVTCLATCAASLLAPAQASAGDLYDNVYDTAYDTWEGLNGYLVPSIGIGLSARMSEDDGEDAVLAIGGWLGMTYYLYRARFTPMVQFAAELEWRSPSSTTALTTLMPTARVGMAWLGCFRSGPQPSYASALLPCGMIYALAGVRPGDDRDRYPAAARLGVGLNAPPLMLLMGCVLLILFGPLVVQSMTLGG